SIAETATGGCVRRATMSVAVTRPTASATETVSAGRGFTAARMRPRASATEIIASAMSGRLPGAGLAAGFVGEADGADGHAAIDGFHHVVDGEGGDADGGER